MKKLSLKLHINKFFPKRFDKHWKKIRSSKNIDKTLIQITDNFINSKSYKLVSNFWHVLNIKNYQTLSDLGIKKYGSTIARNYYTFTEIINDELINETVNNLKNYPFKIDSVNFFKKHDGFTLTESITVNYLCYLLFYNLKKTKIFEHINKLQDKTYLGFNDPYIEIEGINVTTDKIISLLDYEKIQKAFEIKKFKKVLEIGAGSGRTSEAILSVENNLKYIVCDIPPAIYLSYSRLKLAFPKKRISLLIDINNKNDLEEKIENSDISFIFPHQLEILNKRSIDLVLAIDCMHEMDKTTIQYYFNLFNHIAKNFYFSIWSKTDVPYSANFLNIKNTLDYNAGDYKIPKHWLNIFNEKLIFPSNFLSLGFKIDN